MLIKTKRYILLSLWLGSFLSVTAQHTLSDLSSEPFIGSGRLPVGLYVGTNIPPIPNGEYSLILSYYNSRHLDYHLSAGFGEDPKRGTYLKPEIEGYHELGKGRFIKLGADYNLYDKSGLANGAVRLNVPYIGVRIIGSRIQETREISSATTNVTNTIYEKHTSSNYSLGHYSRNNPQLFRKNLPEAWCSSGKGTYRRPTLQIWLQPWNGC